MRYVDSYGTDHIIGESDSVFVLSDDERCLWGFDNTGRAIVTIDGEEVLNVLVEIEGAGRWLSIPYRPISTNKILYHRTHVQQEWKGYKSVGKRGKNPKRPAERYKNLGVKTSKCEVGMRFNSRLNDGKAYAWVRFLVYPDRPSMFEVETNKPTRVHIRTGEYEKTFEESRFSVLLF